MKLIFNATMSRWPPVVNIAHSLVDVHFWVSGVCLSVDCTVKPAVQNVTSLPVSMPPLEEPGQPSLDIF